MFIQLLAQREEASVFSCQIFLKSINKQCSLSEHQYTQVTQIMMLHWMLVVHLVIYLLLVILRNLHLRIHNSNQMIVPINLLDEKKKIKLITFIRNAIKTITLFHTHSPEAVAKIWRRISIFDFIFFYFCTKVEKIKSSRIIKSRWRAFWYCLTDEFKWNDIIFSFFVIQTRNHYDFFFAFIVHENRNKRFIHLSQFICAYLCLFCLISYFYFIICFILRCFFFMSIQM